MGPNSKPGYGALRRGRVSIPGQIYCLTAVAASRRALFAEFVVARLVIMEMRFLQRRGWLTSLALVVMPDHVHWLIELGPVSLEKAAQTFKGRTARQLSLSCAVHGPVWQPGFHDRALRSEENVVAAARYIIMNPVRAGLVKTPGDFPHWDCLWL
jgi:REP element-mobilizing transposase RayT